MAQAELDLPLLNELALTIAKKYGATGYGIPQINFATYVVRIRTRPDIPFVLDPWQKDLCRRLEQAFWCANAKKFEFIEVNLGVGVPYMKAMKAPNGFKIPLDEFRSKENLGTLAAIHAPPQFGKSNIIAVAYPCWILGFDHKHRFRLATYNIFHSSRFSQAIQRIMRSPEHKAAFPDPAGHLPVRTKFVEWSTNARLDLNDGQSSFTALGLTSGFVGTGADTLLQDDPYASAEDARSETIRDSTWRFQSETAKPRLREYSNNFIMFHRYHTDDQGGRAIASGAFELWRYAARADGEYEDEGSGRKFPCFPLDRKEGEYLSPRYPLWYYASQEIQQDVWNSQFQGRPTSKTGTFFDVTKLNVITAAEYESRVMVHQARAWDNAATEKGGDWTAGARVAMDAPENFYLANMKRAQVDTAGRQQLQELATAEDGLMVPIHFPEDPASAGKDIAFFFRQQYEPEGYTVVTEKVTGKKTARADEFSKVVNSGRFYVVMDDGTGRYVTPEQLKAFKAELRDFPFVGTHDDQVDCTADAVNYLQKLFLKGRVIKVDSDDNMLGWSRFGARFGEKIPGNCEVAIACRIAPNKTLPSGWALVARAAENMKLGEVVFVVASARKYVDDPGIILSDIKTALKMYCAKGAAQCQGIWIAKGNDDVTAMAMEKYDLMLQEFPDDESAGLRETAWYFQKLKAPNPFFDSAKERNVPPASHCYIMSDDGQIDTPANEFGQLSLRQDMLHWSYNDSGKPQPFGGIVLDCVRMTLYNFWLTATALTDQEKRYAKLSDELQPAAVSAKLGTPDFVEAYWAQQRALQLIRDEEREENESQDSGFVRPAQLKRYRPKKS